MNTVSTKKRLFIFTAIAFVLINISIWNYAIANNRGNDVDTDPVYCVTEGDGSVLNYGTHEYWLTKYPEMRYIDSLTYGQTLDSGVYCIPESITLLPAEGEFANDTEPKSALKINGDVTLIFENNSVLTVKGRDANDIYGAGAGIELSEGNSLNVRGLGKIKANGGNGAKGQNGEAGKNAGTDKGYSGASGAGGNGGAGAGSAIGTCGGDAGTGGAAKSGRKQHHGFSDYHGFNGDNGNAGCGSDSFGTFKVYGNVQIIVDGGKGSKDNPSWPIGGDSGLDEYSEGFQCTYAGGGAGGCGGYGFPAAAIGTGGSGGGGAGSGGSGGAGFINFFHKKHYKFPAGGGGGSGLGYIASGIGTGEIELGSCYRYQDGEHLRLKNQGRIPHQASEGGNNYTYEKIHGGNGGDGGSTGYSGKAEYAFSTTPIKISPKQKDNYEGKDASIQNFYPASECTIINFSKTRENEFNYDVVHVPTGTILTRDEDYFERLIANEDNNCYCIQVQGIPGAKHMLTDDSLENSGMLVYTTKPVAPVDICYYEQNLNKDKSDVVDEYSLCHTESSYREIGSVVNYTSKDIEGFVELPHEDVVVNSTGTTVNIYYNRLANSLVLHQGDNGAWPQETFSKKVYYGSLIQTQLPEYYRNAQLNYIFDTWNPNIDIESTMPNKNLELTATWNPLRVNTSYVVEEWFQDVTPNPFSTRGDTYHCGTTNYMFGISGTLTQFEPKEYENYVVQPFEQQIISCNGDTVVRVYYDRVKCNLEIDYGPHGWYLYDHIFHCEITYGKDISEVIKIGEWLVFYDDGYELLGYDVDIDKPIYITSDMHIQAKWKSNWNDITINQPGVGRLYVDKEKCITGDYVFGEFVSEDPSWRYNVDLKFINTAGEEKTVSPRWLSYNTFYFMCPNSNVTIDAHSVDVEVVVSQQPEVGTVECSKSTYKPGEKVECIYKCEDPYMYVDAKITDSSGHEIFPVWTSTRTFNFICPSSKVSIEARSIDRGVNFIIEQPKEGLIVCDYSKALMGTKVTCEYKCDNPCMRVNLKIIDSFKNEYKYEWVETNKFIFACPIYDFKIIAESYNPSVNIAINPPKSGKILIDKTTNVMPGEIVKINYNNPNILFYAALNISDKQGNKIAYKCINKNEFTFVCPCTDVTINATSHKVVKFIEKVVPTAGKDGLRAYYITDDGLYFRANDAYSDAINKDNSVGTLIGDINDFNEWKEVYCSDHTTSQGVHYAKGWGGKIEPDM